MRLSTLKESKLLAKHSSIYGLGTVLQYIAGFLLLPIYTRFLSPHEYGIQALVGLTVDVIAILVSISISSSVYRFYFEYEHQQDRNEVISSALMTVGLFSLFAVFLLSFASKTMAKYILNSKDLYYYFLISFSSMWFQSMNQIGFSYLRANQQSFKYVILSSSSLLLAIAINIYLVCFLKMGVLGILISTLITSIAMSIGLLVPLISQIGFHYSHTKIKEMLKFGLPLIPSQLGAFVVHVSGRFFVKEYCSIADAGLYSIGYRFGGLPSNLVSVPFNQTWLPRRLELYKTPGSEELFGKIFTYFLFLMIFVGLCISVLIRDFLVILLDARYWSSYKIVPIIVLATTIFTFQYHFNMGIIIKKKTKYFAYIDFSNGVIILILNFVLIPQYGIYGAAYATLWAFVYKVSLIYYFSNKYYKIYFEFMRIGKLLVAAASIYISSLMLNFGSVYVSFVIKSCIVLLFPLVLYGFSFYTHEEKRKIAKYIKQRFQAVLKTSPCE